MPFYRRVATEAWKDTCAIWNIHKLMFSLCGIVSAVGMAVFGREKIHMSEWFLGLLFVFGLFIPWLVTYLTNCVRAPSTIYGDQEAEISHLRTIAYPAVTVQEQRKRRSALRAIRGLDPVSKRILRHMLGLDWVDPSDLMSGNFTTSGIPLFNTPDVLLKTGLVEEDTQGNWSIKPSLRCAVDFALKELGF